MPESEKITILLADEDALRRDGLAAVLQGTPAFQVIAQSPDGDDALRQIRNLSPDVAVVDLNIPKLHGIELVRRIRAEGLKTKIVILSGTTDDDIIREVVRAGGDAYLLKNGPARHLVDAISYVRDGGQYFSPQLHRDGLQRHLLEEMPRTPPPPERLEEAREEAETPAASRPARDARYGRPRRPVRRTSEPARLRERLREDRDSENLEDRDYEILGMMADGIRPILDRLDEIEGRVVQMESGDEPVPSDVRNWLSSQMTDTFRDPRAGGKEITPRSAQDLEARLPQLIEQAVNSRFQHMAEKLHQDIEETHVRTLETFVKNIQVKLVQRVSALETDMSRQAEAVMQLREYSQRTEDNLSRLISGVDRLAQELPKRLAAPEEPASAPVVEPKARRRKSSRSFSPKLFWIVAVVAVAVAGGGAVLLKPGAPKEKKAAAAPADAGQTPAAAATFTAPAPIPAGADSKAKLQAAQEYADRKDYATAEDIYKQVIKAEPNNLDALKALASVLYREDKIEESAAILDKLPHN